MYNNNNNDNTNNDTNDNSNSPSGEESPKGDNITKARLTFTQLKSAFRARPPPPVSAGIFGLRSGCSRRVHGVPSGSCVGVPRISFLPEVPIYVCIYIYIYTHV